MNMSSWLYLVVHQHQQILLFGTAKLNHAYHCVKSIRIRGFSGPYFPAFGLNTDWKNSEYGHSLRSVLICSKNNNLIGSN